VNGAQALIRTLAGCGVEVCFANPGTSEMHFVAALDTVPEMRGVLCLSEGVVTGAADGYVLSDRGTWIHFKNKGDLQILVEGDKRMFNQYGVMLVNPEKHPDVKKELGQQFIDIAA